MQQHPTAWLVDRHITVLPNGRSVPTPELNSAAHLIGRIGEQLVRGEQKEGTVLLTDDAAQSLGLLDVPRERDQYQRGMASLEAAGWRTTGSGLWTTVFGLRGLSVHVGLVDALDRAGAWTFWECRWDQTVQAIDEWNRATGKAWGQDPAIIGVELIHATMRPWREPGVKGNRPVEKRDEHTHPTWEEIPYTLTDFGRKEPGATWLHGYDKRRAGISAANKTKCAVGPLTNGWRKYDPKRAGWWQIEIPAWNMPELPHPVGPDAKAGKLRHVTSATMDLLAELSEQGLIAFPDIIESWTATARPVLQGFSDLLENLYQETSNVLVRDMVKEVGNAGIGMLGNERGSLYRRDWMFANWATKRANLWRTAFRVGNKHSRYPVAFDDDKIWYGSTQKDPVLACPGELLLNDDRRGFRPESTMEVTQ